MKKLGSLNLEGNELLNREQLKMIVGGIGVIEEDEPKCVKHKKECEPYWGDPCCKDHPTCARLDSSNPNKYYCGIIGEGW